MKNVTGDSCFGVKIIPAKIAVTNLLSKNIFMSTDNGFTQALSVTIVMLISNSRDLKRHIHWYHYRLKASKAKEPEVKFQTEFQLKRKTFSLKIV